MSENQLLVYFNIFIVVMLALDLGVFQRRAHFPSMKEALGWTAVWVSLALLFNVYIYFELGSQKALEFFTGYLVEEALSVDNVFVFIIILTYFAVPADFHHRVLFWGVLGAIIMRSIFIIAGTALVEQFHWIIYLLGAFLIFTAIKLATQKEMEIHPDRNPVVRLCRKIFPLVDHFEGPKFLLRKDNKWFATPLLLVLVMIETTDLAFATDSIPAIFAITRDTFVIYTSNIFAVLGLRALYFVVAGFMKEFRYLKYGLSFVLGFIGVKMLIEKFLEIPILYSLLIIFGIIAISVVASLVVKPKEDGQE